MKQRLDVKLFELGLADSREKAKALIMSGVVFVNDQKADKPGTTVDESAHVELRGDTLRYVSRGGTKLEKAIETFNIDLGENIAADIGASTGGFTDCMLQNGAAKVYAVDVGYGQLAWTLRNDPRVINLERKNARYLTSEDISDSLDFFSVDASFISLKTLLPPVIALCKPSAEAVCLIKPQFEAGREHVGKNGVVRDAETHIEVIETIISYVKKIGLSVCGLTFSPIKGPKGNIEFLMYLKNTVDGSISLDIPAVVFAAQNDLK